MFLTNEKQFLVVDRILYHVTKYSAPIQYKDLPGGLQCIDQTSSVLVYIVLRYAIGCVITHERENPHHNPLLKLFSFCYMFLEILHHILFFFYGL